MELRPIKIVSFFWAISSVFARSKVLHVFSRPYEPFVYINSSGAFVDGIEYHLIQTIAEKLRMEVAFTPLLVDFNLTEIE